jgi:hypothetical protein
MTMSRVALVVGALLVAGLLVVFIITNRSVATPLLTIAALAVLIGGGNLLYGKNSHGAAAQARIRPAQEAQNRAIDEARRQAAEAAAPTAPPTPPTPPEQPAP